MKIQSAYQELETSFEASRDSERALKMRKYMRDKFPFYGVNAPKRKDLQKDFCRSVASMEINEIRSAIDLLWSNPHREMQYCACDLMSRVSRKLIEADITWMERLILTKSWWDTVDALSGIVGKHFLLYPGLQPGTTDKWVDSPELWLKRVALIHQLKYREATNWPLLKKYVLKVADTDEFFLAKGAGWALRQYAKFAPEQVKLFLAKHTLPALTVREASTYLD